MPEWTPEKAQKFFAVLADTGNVSRACTAVGMSRSGAYNLRSGDEYFSRLWDEALEVFTDNLEEEAFKRAFEGWDEPVFYKGKQCGAKRRKSDRLMEFLLRGNRPEKYKDRAEIQQHHSGGATVRIVHMDNGREAPPEPDES